MKVIAHIHDSIMFTEPYISIQEGLNSKRTFGKVRSISVALVMLGQDYSGQELGCPDPSVQAHARTRITACACGKEGSGEITVDGKAHRFALRAVPCSTPANFRLPLQTNQQRASATR